MGRREEVEAVIEAFAGRGGKGWLRANCPLCEERHGTADQRQCLGLNTATGGYNCQRCGLKGYVPEELRDEIPYMPVHEVENVEKPPVQIAEGYIPLYEQPGISSTLCDPARRYLTRTGPDPFEPELFDPNGRGLPEAVLAETRMGVVLTGYLMHRIVMPIPDYSHPEPWSVPWRGWSARTYLRRIPPMRDGRPGRKYLYPKNMNREGLLFNEPALWVETDRPVYVVESILDTEALWPDSVAVLGQPIDSQISKLVSALRPVVVALDGDVWETSWTLALKLRHYGQRAGSLRFPPRTDPGEVPRDLLDAAGLRSLATFDAVRI